MTNVPTVFPAGMDMVGGTTTDDLSEASLIGSPPAGARLPIVIVPVTSAPPDTDVGFKLKLMSLGGLTVIDPEIEVVL